jgi:hypothetical protein
MSEPLPPGSTRLQYVRRNLDAVIQYTGLKDRNGVDIYDDYVVEYADPAGQPQWMKVGYQVGAYVLMHEGHVAHKLGDLVLERLTVLGNVYEHPELLAQEAAPPTQAPDGPDATT